MNLSIDCEHMISIWQLQYCSKVGKIIWDTYDFIILTLYRENHMIVTILKRCGLKHIVFICIVPYGSNIAESTQSPYRSYVSVKNIAIQKIYIVSMCSPYFWLLGPVNWSETIVILVSSYTLIPLLCVSIAFNFVILHC